MHFHGLVLLLVAATATQWGAASTDCEEPMLLARNNLCQCPVNCRCYTWSKLRRVDCVRNRLANINANDVPIKVQVLDISDNLIAELTDGYFWGLSGIQYLHIARNAVHNLEPLALSGLRRLTVLDLSDNRLRVLPPGLFSETPRIKELRLAGNHLVSLSVPNQPSPVLEARQLQELDVSRCNLAYLSTSAFVGVSRIISLNVSNNQFLQLPARAIAPLRLLRHLYADGNPFNCDAEMEKLTSLLKESNVTSSGLCAFPTTSAPPSAPPKFARMIALPEPTSYYKREPEPDYPYDWEREEPGPYVPQDTPPRSAPPADPGTEYSEKDQCGAVTKPERFFKFEYSNLLSVIIGFKIGFVTALLLLRGCHGRARPQPLPTTDPATNERLLRQAPHPQRARGNGRSSPEAGAGCEPEQARPETPPPAYHELRFNMRRAFSSQ